MKHVQRKLGIGLTLLIVAAIPLLALKTPTGRASSPAPSGRATTAGDAIGYGMDMGSIDALAAQGAKPDYATLWVGPWTLDNWAGTDKQIDHAVAANVTPVIQYYYWGDDISQSCLEKGCWSRLHHAQKTPANWQKLADQLATHLDAHLKGRPVVIILETEFNKGDVAQYEPLDGYLAEKARFFHTHVPHAQVALGFGNWNPKAWHVFDRAAAASDLVGLQAMRGSTHENQTQYRSLPDALVEGAKTLQSLFHKPVIVTDIALSSYPDSGWAQLQANTLRALFAAGPQLKAAGVRIILYRSWFDSPNMDTANYYGAAERHWGLSTSPGGAEKPAARVWVDAVKADRGSA